MEALKSRTRQGLRVAGRVWPAMGTSRWDQSGKFTHSKCAIQWCQFIHRCVWPSPQPTLESLSSQNKLCVLHPSPAPSTQTPFCLCQFTFSGLSVGTESHVSTCAASFFLGILSPRFICIMACVNISILFNG